MSARNNNNSPAEEAEQLMRKAEGSMAPSLLSFRLSPDWETACPLFERAALLFKVRPGPRRKKGQEIQKTIPQTADAAPTRADADADADAATPTPPLKPNNSNPTTSRAPSRRSSARPSARRS
jgi:hypothetical protein